MGLKLKNNAASSLAASIAAGETLVRVLAGHGARFPVLNTGDWYPVAVQNAAGAIEYMRAVGRAGDVMTVIRGRESSVALDFEAGDVIFLPLTVAAQDAMGVIDGDVVISVDDTTVTA